MNNSDMANLMNIISKMDKKDLKDGLIKLSGMLNSTDKDIIINEIKKNM